MSQRAGTLFGHPIRVSLDQVPDPVDLAVLAVPNTAMAETLRACGRRGIRAAILVSAGFREAGPEGAALEAECLEVAHEYDIRLLGPNCIGIVDTHLPLDTTFLQPPPPGMGSIGFLSHSGAFCAAIIDWARREGFGFSQVVSLGNQLDVTETDMLGMVVDSPHTRAVALYMEGVANGRRFVDEAQAATLLKPVVALKVGRYESGHAAAASHTGALAAADNAFDAAFLKAGVQRATSAEQMFDWLRALDACPLPKGHTVAVLTDAGGPGVIAADALEANGLTLAHLSDETRAALAAQLPAAASLQNPVDMLASASPQDYSLTLERLLNDVGVDAGLVILPPPPMFTAESVAEAVIPVIKRSSKPVLVALMGSDLVENARAAFTEANVPTYPFPERAASALGALARRADYLQHPRLDHRPAEAQGSLEVITAVNGKMADELLSAYKISSAPSRLAVTPEQAASIAEELGCPVVLKIASPDILHKSDVGGVLLNMRTTADVFTGYSQIVEAVHTARPHAHIAGVMVQQHAPDGQEVIIGAKQDPTFGALMMFGSGGVEAEGLKDVAFALAPLDDTAAREMMGRTWAGRRLNGFRNLPPADMAAARDALIRLSWLAHDHPEIKEIEINPLRVLEKGVVALDIRIVL